MREVKRLMVVRATSIHLNPYLEKSCMKDLAIVCQGVDTSAAGEVRKL